MQERDAQAKHHYNHQSTTTPPTPAHTHTRRTLTMDNNIVSSEALESLKTLSDQDKQAVGQFLQQEAQRSRLQETVHALTGEKRLVSPSRVVWRLQIPYRYLLPKMRNQQDLLWQA
jgi:hypothetical protein